MLLVDEEETLEGALEETLDELAGTLEEVLLLEDAGIVLETLEDLLLTGVLEATDELPPTMP